MRTLALFGCPRSGTSWLGQIVNAHPEVAYRYQPLFAYEFKDWFDHHGLSAASVRAFHAALLEARSDFVLQDLRPAKAATPSHLLWKEVRYHQLMQPLLATGALDGLVYLYRAPEDVLNSWYQAPKEFRAGQDIFAEYLHAPSKNAQPCEFNGFARWKESMRLALAAHAAHPGRVRLLRYEQLCAQPQRVVRQLLAWCGLPAASAVEDFITASTQRHDDDAYSVFRSRPAPMRLPAAIVTELQGDTEALALLKAADRSA